MAVMEVPASNPELPISRYPHDGDKLTYLIT
jgi:hypothetical protein